MHRLTSIPILALTTALILVGGALVGCAAHPVSIDSPTPTATPKAECAAPGAASDAVTATGALGEAPKITANGPFDVDTVQRTVLSTGPGDVVQRGDYVQLAVTILNATTGDQAPGTAVARTLLDPGSMQPGLLDTVLCSTVGSRVVGVVPSDEAYGTAGQPDLAIGPDDDVVFVVDVIAVILLHASGTPQALPDGFPSLRLDFDTAGRPTVGIPAVDPPATRQVATLIVGPGTVVAATDEFLIQFEAVNWRTGAVFDQTWGDAPRSLLSVVPGVTSAIIGSTVGSRLIVICPPVDGFGAIGDPAAGVLGTDTVVYVVDILAVTAIP
ncbi:MAG: hypothetical protein ABIR17_08455 [Pseudolysinimonas sp.]|uniref:FKBP-type peptidyl-prolyl cis-trans isomerase n=1 Tax=Pseudolysinimonas sp. TaxID=2680009 RepID=UPI0032635B2A